jgi:hypothetical protein
MLAALPKRNQDDGTGEMFVEIYRLHLGGCSREAMDYLTLRATAECEWFPTVKQCLDILEGWERNDEHVQRRNKAWTLIMQERSKRAREEKPHHYEQEKLPPFDQAFVDGLTPHMLSLGVKLGFVLVDEHGNRSVAPVGPNEVKSWRD